MQGAHRRVRLAAEVARIPDRYLRDEMGDDTQWDCTKNIDDACDLIELLHISVVISGRAREVRAQRGELLAVASFSDFPTVELAICSVCTDIAVMVAQK